jgi:uncharacterized Zn-binding protein involved in type VI secretion
MPPAARMGDMTAHGGAIVLGCPTVLIGGMPAARMSDMHMCPMVTPGLPPIPHVGGPVTLGSPMVLIGGMPAARMGDMLVCVGPPDSIMMGCFTVLVGEGGSGSASSSGGGGGGAGGTGTAKGGRGGAGSSSASSGQTSGPSSSGAMAVSALMAQSGSQESDTKWEHWVEFDFVDKAGNPVSGIPYEFTGPDGKKKESVLQSNGKVRRDGLSAGQCKVRLFNVYHAQWSRTSARIGEKVKLSTDTEGFHDNEEGTISIYRRDLSRADTRVATLRARVKGNRLETEWEYPAEKKDKETSPSAVPSPGYSSPEYYFEVEVGPCKTRSSFLYFEDFIELSANDQNGRALANEEYLLRLPDGSTRRGKLDAQGHKKEEKVPAGKYTVEFPNLPRPDK